MVMYSLHFQVGNVHNYAPLFVEATTCHPRESSNHVRKLLVLKPGEVDDVFRELFSQWNQTGGLLVHVFIGLTTIDTAGNKLDNLAASFSSGVERDSFRPG